MTDTLTDPTVQLDPVKTKHRAMWALGDYDKVATEVVHDLGERIVDALAITAPELVLDVAAGQAQFGQQLRNFGATHHERFGADIHRLARDPLGTQDSAEPVGRVEHHDVGVGAGQHAQPVGGDQTRNAAPDNAIAPAR